MYNTLLSNVINVIKSTTEISSKEKMDNLYLNMFSPLAAQEQLESMAKRQEVGTKLILGATALAVIGEVYHVARRSDILSKIKK